MSEGKSLKAIPMHLFPFKSLSTLPFVSLTSNTWKQNNHLLFLVPRRPASGGIKESTKLGNKWLMRDRSLD